MDDIEEIKKLKARYFRALDSKDWETYRSVSWDDAVVDLSRAGGGVYDGAEAFAAYASALEIVQSVHHGHMPEIELTAHDAATGVWAMEDYNVWTDGHQNHGWGHYVEAYEKRNGDWRIKTMRLSYLRIESSEARPLLIAGAQGTTHLRGRYVTPD